MKGDPESGRALYVHVPFCRRKCLYCAFYSVAPPDRDRQRQYLRALERELAALPSGGFRTVYIGGGTPTSLDAGFFERLLQLVGRRAGAAEEWTCEANPESLTPAKIRLLQQAGVNRVSLGVQTFSVEGLRRLGRRHTPEDVRRAVAGLRAAGLENISLDLMYGLPGSDRGTVERDVAEALRLQPQHVSVYLLSVEEGTRFQRMQESGELVLPPEDELAGQYELIRQRLAAEGFRQYEISNFALPGYECRHNLVYWSAGEYYGCGPGAHSYAGGRRWANPADLERWSRSLLWEGKVEVEPDEELSPERRARELLVLGLRRVEGVDRRWFRDVTGFDYRELCAAAIRRLSELGLLREEADRLRLTERAYFVSDAVFRELI